MRAIKRDGAICQQLQSFALRCSDSGFGGPVRALRRKISLLRERSRPCPAAAHLGAIATALAEQVCYAQSSSSSSAARNRPVCASTATFVVWPFFDPIASK